MYTTCQLSTSLSVVRPCAPSFNPPQFSPWPKHRPSLWNLQCPPRSKLTRTIFQPSSVLWNLQCPPRSKQMCTIFQPSTGGNTGLFFRRVDLAHSSWCQYAPLQERRRRGGGGAEETDHKRRKAVDRANRARPGQGLEGWRGGEGGGAGPRTGTTSCPCT